MADLLKGKGFNNDIVTVGVSTNTWGFFFLHTWIFPNKTKFCLLYSERNVKKTIEKVSLWNINLWSGYFKAFNISKGRSNFCSSSFSNNENNLLQKSTSSELSLSSGVLWWHDSMLFSIISLWQWSTALSFISRFWQEPSCFHAAVAIQMFSLAPNFLTDFSTEPISKWNESNLDSNKSKWDFKSFFFFLKKCSIKRNLWIQRNPQGRR